MDDLEATCVLPAAAQLGECPVWSPDDARLYWVDIDGRAVHRFDPATGARRAASGARATGVAGPDRDPGPPARRHRGPARRSSTGTPGRGRDWIALEPEGVGNRLNDGRCDPAGRFWVGSMFDPAAAGKATGLLHRVEPDGTAAHGAVGDRRAERARLRAGRADDVLRRHPPRHGLGVRLRRAIPARPPTSGSSSTSVRCPGRPDGACVDEAGCYWIACVCGSAVLRVTPAGAIDRTVARAGRRSRRCRRSAARTSRRCSSRRSAAAGPTRVDPAQPDAGGLFAVETGVSGLPETRVRGRSRGRDRRDGDDPAARLVRAPGPPRARRVRRGGVHGPRPGHRRRSATPASTRPSPPSSGRRRTATRSWIARPGLRGHRPDRHRLRRGRRRGGDPARDRGLQHARRPDDLDRRARGHADAARRQEREAAEAALRDGTVERLLQPPRRDRARRQGPRPGRASAGSRGTWPGSPAASGCAVAVFDPYLAAAAVPAGIDRADTLDALLARRRRRVRPRPVDRRLARHVRRGRASRR